MSITIDSATSRAADRTVERAAPSATDNRAQIAREIRTTKDQEKLQELVFLYILEVTRNDKTPDDRWRSIEKEVIALRPRDGRFLVTQLRGCLNQLWQAQGRSPEVWNKLLPFIRNRDWAGVKAEVANELAVLAKTSPTKDAIEAYRDNTLLLCGPKEPNFRKAVKEAASEFLTTGPANAASEIARVYEIKGADAAARKLRDLTRTTPLQAALILNQAKPTIDIICRAFQPSIGGTYIPNKQQIFNDLAAAVDSASRSQEATQTIEQIGSALCRTQIHSFVNVAEAVAEGNLTILLEMLKQLRGPRDGYKADLLSTVIKDGLGDLRGRVEQAVLEFARTVQPLQNPEANWGELLPSADGQPFKTPDQTLKQWLAAHSDFRPRADSALKNLNIPGYQMTRAIAALDRYLPDLPPSGNVDKMRKIAEVPADSTVAFAQAVSPEAGTEAARLFNTMGLHGIALEDPNKIVPDLSWPSRTGRNLGQKIELWRTGMEPFGLGLSLYGTGTYIWGFKNQATELYRDWRDPGYMLRRGWRVMGFMGMYAAGTLVEGTKVAAHIASKWKDLEASTSALGRFAAGAAGSVEGSTWKRYFSNHLKAFGWFNAAGSVWYFIYRDYARGTALGLASGGTLLSTYAPAARIGLRVFGNVATLAGSLVLVGLNLRDQERRRTLTEPFNKDYLITAGLRPAIAEQLAKNDRDGLSAGPKLEQLAKYLGVTPQKLLQYLNDQDPAWVGAFLSHGVQTLLHPNELNQYPQSRPGQNLGMINDAKLEPGLPPEASSVYATTLQGTVEWAARSGHPLPRGK